MFKKIFFIFICIFSCMFFSCATTEPANSTELISTNSYAVGKLEATVEGLDDLVSSSTGRLEAIRKQSEGITDGIDKLEYLFDQYECEINRILNEVIEVRNEVANRSEDNNNCGNYTVVNDTSEDSSHATKD